MNGGRRALAFAGIAALGTVAAMACVLYLPSLGVGGDAAMWAIIAHYPLVILATVACGLAMAAAAVSNRRRSLDPRRLLAATAVLLVLGVGALLAPSAVVASWDFDAAAFREARAEQDDDTLERQAHLAVEDRALIGRSRGELRGRLGAPDRIGRRRHLWVYDVGFINDFIGPGDAGYLYVRFDASWRRVVDARVSTYY